MKSRISATLVKVLVSGAVLCLSAVSSGCYLLSQGRYLLSDRIRAVPVEDIRQSEDISQEEHEFLAIAEDVRRFARQLINSPGSRNYTTYVRTDRSYLAAVVSAAGAVSLQPYRWHFPFIGSVPYKGFYRSEPAFHEADRLEQAGYDVWVRKVDAFSTLGFTADPLYSFMTDYPVHRIAELIIHEETHAALWIKNETQFNEELASFIGDTGAEIYIRQTYGEDSAQRQAMEDSRHDRQQWLSDMSRLRRTLEELYAQPLSRDDKLKRKTAIFQTFKEDFAAVYQDRYRTEAYAAVPDLEMNNAFAALYAAYYEHNDLMETLYTAAGKNLTRMMELLAPLKKNGKDPHQFVQELIRSLQQE